MRIADAMKEVHETAREKGWWEDCIINDIAQGFDHELFDPTQRNVGETFLLMQSEISEAFEHYRNGKPVNEIIYYDTDHNDYPTEEQIHHRYEDLPGDVAAATLKPDGIPIELADCIIRIFDFCAANNIDLEAALRIKMNYNKTRPFKHGNKKA